MFMQTHIFINIAKGTERKRRHVSYIKYYSEDYICICYTWYSIIRFSILRALLHLLISHRCMKIRSLIITYRNIENL